MRLKLLCLFAAIFCMSSSVLGQQHSDVELGYDDLAAPSEILFAPTDLDLYTQDGILLTQSSMELLDPFNPNDFSSDQPGFATNAGLDLLLNPGDHVSLKVLDGSIDSAFGVGFVNFYNPATDMLEPSGRIAVKDNTTGTPDLILSGAIIESGVNQQFVDTANGNGDIHDHIVFDLLDDQTALTGAYGVLVQVETDFAPVDGIIDLSSEPFWIVFNYGLTSGEFELAIEKFGIGAEIESVTPESWEVTAGNHVSGGVAELGESDNIDLSAQRRNNDIASRVFVEFGATLSTDAPTSLEITAEASVFARSSVQQVIDLWNFDSGSWEQVDSRNAARFTDSTTTIELSGDLSRFVEPGTRAVRARLKMTSSSPRQRFTLNVDHIVWTFGR